MSSQRHESLRRHSTVIKDIVRNGPRGSISSGSRFALDTSKRIYERGPRTLRAQIADSENSADFAFPATQAFFTGVVQSWFTLVTFSAETIRDASLSFVLSPERNFAEPRKKRKP